MKIKKWLSQFKTSWENKNIEKIISLFSPDIEYWETPFVKLNSINEVEKEWQNILEQDQIDFNYVLFSEENYKYTVKWDLKYLVKEGVKNQLKGIYLITLNKDGLCLKFEQCCEIN